MGRSQPRGDGEGADRRREQQVQRPGGRTWLRRFEVHCGVGGGSVARDELQEVGSSLSTSFVLSKGRKEVGDSARN